MNVTLPTATVNQPYATTLEGAGGAAPYVFTLQAGALPSGITFNNGTLSGTPTQSGSFSFQLQATDANGCTGAEDFTLQVNCPALDLAPGLLAAGTYGTAYTPVTIAPVGGFAPYSFSASGLPAGMTFNATTNSVTIGGTPTQSGSFNVTVNVTDAFGCGITNPRVYPLTINKAPLTVRAEDKTKEAGAPLPALTHALIGLVNNDPVSVIGGAPVLNTIATTNSNVGNYPITISQGSLNAANYSFNLVNGTLRVVCPVTASTLPAMLPNGVIGTAYNANVTAAPSDTYSYSVTAGTLPPGITLNPSSGALTGTLQALGTYQFTIAATRFGSCTTSQTYAVNVTCVSPITVLPKPAALSTSFAYALPAATVKLAYSTMISVTPKAGNPQFSVIAAPNLLPAGLTLDPVTGVISGIPTETGAFVFRVQATLFGSCANSQLYSMRVLAPGTR